MAGFIGFIICMIVLGNIIEGLSSAETAMFLSALLAFFASYRFSKRYLTQLKKAKDQNRLEEQKEQLRKEIREEQDRIAAIREIQPETIDEPYYPETRYFNK